MSIYESRNFSVEVCRDGMKILIRFHGCTPEEVKVLSENAEFMLNLIEQCNEEGDFTLEVERKRTIH